MQLDPQLFQKQTKRLQQQTKPVDNGFIINKEGIPMPEIKVTMRVEKETKGAVKYVAIDDNGKFVEDFTAVPMSNVYVRKSELGGKIPVEVTLTMSWETGERKL